MPRSCTQPEADQGDGPGNQSGDDGNQTFGAVVNDGEVLLALAPANAVQPGRISGNGHTAIIEARGCRGFTGCCGAILGQLCPGDGHSGSGCVTGRR